MRLQDSQANCGPCALRNALVAMGISRSLEELEMLAGTSPTRGTSVRGIMRAANSVEGCNPVRIKEKRRDVALLKLHAGLQAGRSVILSWKAETPSDHWVAAVGLLGDRFLIADSGDSELVYSLDTVHLISRWHDDTYEGVIL